MPGASIVVSVRRAAFLRGRDRPRGARRGPRHRAGDGKVAVFGTHPAAWQHEELVHIGRPRHDGLHAGNHDAIRAPLAHMDIGQRLDLLRRAPGTVALAVGHSDADGEVMRLRVGDIGLEPVMALAAGALGDAPGRFPQPVERVVGQVALGAAAILAGEAHRLELVEQVLPAAIDREEAVDRIAGNSGRDHDLRGFGQERKIVGQPHRVDAGLQPGLIRHRGHQIAADINARGKAAQRFTIGFGGLEHGAGSPSAYNIRP